MLQIFPIFQLSIADLIASSLMLSASILNLQDEKDDRACTYLKGFTAVSFIKTCNTKMA